MAEEQAGTRPARDDGPLTRRRVLAAAVALADAEGLDGLSMRRLGEAVGVRAMSLYHHVADKDDLLDGMLDLLAEDVDRAPDAPGWRAVATRQARSLHAVLLAHPWATTLWLARPGIGPARIAWMDAVLGSLRGDGFDAVAAHRAFHALSNHVVGHAMQHVALGVPPARMAAGARAFLGTLGDDAPWLAEHVRLHADGIVDDPDGFTWVLELILDAVADLRDPARDDDRA